MRKRNIFLNIAYLERMYLPNMNLARQTRTLTCACFALLLLSSCDKPQPDTVEPAPKTVRTSPAAPADKDIIDAYVYLLGRALVIRQEKMDFEDTGLQYNRINYNEAGKADFVNPNLDVAYMEAWVGIDEHSVVVLEIPEIKDRYYTAQFLDGWGEVITNINERNYPDHPHGKFAFCLKPCVELPASVRTIEVPNRKMKMLARVELQDDLEGAIELQKQFKMTTVGSPDIKPPIDLPMFTNKDLPLSSLFQYTGAFMQSPDSHLPESDDIQATVRKVSAYIAQSSERAAQVDQLLKEKGIPQFIQYATTQAGKFQNGWLATLTAGNYHGDYWTRTAANFVGIWANTSEEVIYFIAARDGEGQPLGDGKAYRLHFAADQLPEHNVNGFWSVILVDFPGYRVVDNELQRYNFNNYSEFEYNEDGSLTLYVAPERHEAWPESNWLPSPASQKFNLTLRMYVPKDNVLKGEWFPQALELIKDSNPE